MAVILGVALAACGDTESTGPAGSKDPGSQPQFSRDITFEEFENILGAEGTVRVEIELLPGDPLVAEEVEIESPDEVADEEEVESRILNLLPGSDCLGTGTILLTLLPVEVQFSSATEFEDDAADEDDISCEEFLSRVQAALAEQPPLEAERPPPVDAGAIVAQDPLDPVFEAAELELEDDGDEAEVEINIDMDNLGACGTGAPMDCLGVLTVLNVPIFIVEGVTELKEELGDLAGEVEFEGNVAAVNVTDRTFTLANGPIVRVPNDDIIDPEGDLLTLQDVADEVAAGQPVRAEGDATVESSGLLALEVKFQVDD